MQISNVLSGYADPAALDKPTSPVESRQDKSPNAPALLAGTSATGNTTARDILADYDVTDITAEEFSEMIQRLTQAGLLSDQESRQLAKVRLDLHRAGVQPDESINLIDFYASRIEGLEREVAKLDPAAIASSDKASSLSALRDRLDWLEKFALVQSAPDSLGLDSLA